MKWLPFHRFEIISPLSPSAAAEAFAKHVEPEKLFRWRWPSSANDDRFEGDLYEGAFHVRRLIGYNNSFLPVVDGEIRSRPGGCTIIVKMRLFIFALVFVVVWCAGSAMALLSPTWPIGLVMLLFVYAMTMGAFWFEANKQEHVLRGIFKAA